MRTSFGRHFFVLLFAILALYSFSMATSPLQPDILTCEYIENPLGIDTRKPRFAWTFTSTASNQFQSGYEIIVSTSIKEVDEGRGNTWQSGRVNSSSNIQVEYGGVELMSVTRYYWRVKVFNAEGAASGWSKISWFETGLLAAEWTGQWIGDGSSQPAKEEDYYRDDRMPLFRRTFVPKKKIASARLYISGLGYYEAFLNGKKISDHVLDPGFTTYARQVLYTIHDITPLLKKGTNVAGIMVGNGWWNPLPFKFFGRWDLRDYQQTGRPCVLAEIHIRYTDGSFEKIVSDESWQTAPGPITRNNIYIGEHYDARLEQSDWLTNRSKTNWKNAVTVRKPSGTLVVQMQPPIRVTRILKPVKIVEQKPGVFIVDLGQNFAGVPRIRVKGPSGTKITMRLGEGLFADGSLNVMTTVATQIKKGGIKAGPGAPETMWQEDSYTLKGEGVESWSPRFVFHGFRFIEITGWPGLPTANDIDGLRMNSDLPQNGTFECSNPSFNKLHDVTQWTFLSNVFSVQSDCPGREKMGYGADMVASANAYMYNYDMAHFYGKAVRDFANEQRPKGGMTEIAPFTGIDDRGYGDLSGPLGWQLAFPYLQKELYEFYGDKRIIETYYPALQKQIAFLQSQARGNLFYWDISDHEALDPKPESFSASAFYYHHVSLAAEFSSIIGNKVDSARYAKLAEGIKRSIINQYYVPGSGRFDNSTQSAQLFALWYGFSPEAERSFDVLLKEFERHNWHLSTGIFSTKFLFDVLRRASRNDIAYRVASQPDYPGWLNMLRNDATTLWETWQFPETGPSRNHPMFGSIDEWFYRSLLGINSAAPGFERIVIKPQPVKELEWAKGSYFSVRGLISSEWRVTGDRFRLYVSIPPNTRAEIWVPAKNDKPVFLDGKIIGAPHFENGYAVIKTGSGNYSLDSYW